MKTCEVTISIVVTLNTYILELNTYFLELNTYILETKVFLLMHELLYCLIASQSALFLSLSSSNQIFFTAFNVKRLLH
jgi:hypothetical protein